MLNEERVVAVFHDCLLNKDELTSDYRTVVVAQGIRMNATFDPDRLNGHKTEIKEMLDELPNGFKQSGGGGKSSLHGGFDDHGDLWTTDYDIVEALFLLGMVIGKVQLLPSETWVAGVPNYVVLDVDA